MCVCIYYDYINDMFKLDHWTRRLGIPITRIEEWLDPCVEDTNHMSIPCEGIV